MSQKTLDAIAKREAEKRPTKVTVKVTVTGKPLTDKIIDPEAPA